MTDTTILTRAPVPRDRQRTTPRSSPPPAGRSPTEHTGVALHHVGQYSLDPAALPGNIENFLGVAQVPIGLAGPLRINGEHAQGDFYIPLATTEGTLVASYNRGMRLLTACGGVRTTVVDDPMQRAPVFVFDDALEARTFGEWVDEHFDEIRAARRVHHQRRQADRDPPVRVGPLRYLRFNYTTGDAAGQNMGGKATFAACEWIQQPYPGAPSTSSPARRHRQEALADQHDRHPRQAGRRRGDDPQRRPAARADGRRPRDAVLARQISNAGAFMAGAANNGAHAANGLTAMFIATGQDVANVAESHAGIAYTQLLPNGDYYWSITLPSLIVATYGGGTGLATQRECLETARLLRHGQGQQVRRDLRRGRARRRDVAGQRRPRRRLGLQPRPVRPQPSLTPAP